ncbi:hypothetical protein BRARA_A00085 [Brassica rapa]|uniref:Uncharacterized protein n=2 Tax=Brassica TaxID=3705 RepID=A0A398AI23_BRACM|nr:hypothetical protein BRARA_A00085 [Brassica rapa]CAF2146301.1 unnamed protein product [Brassica napus]CAG7886021.1 unnamed protein product [Brassica rapa]
MAAVLLLKYLTAAEVLELPAKKTQKVDYNLQASLFNGD